MSSKVNQTRICALALVLGFFGCRSVPVEMAAPPISRLRVGESQASVLETGRAIYTGKCTKCHKPKSVEDYSPEDWSSRIMPKMANKAKLTTGEAEAALGYVMAVLSSKSDLNPK